MSKHGINLDTWHKQPQQNQSNNNNTVRLQVKISSLQSSVCV